MNQVWITGDAVIDLIPDGELHYIKAPGGAPANVAVAIARLGGVSSFFSRLGSDPFGTFLHQVLINENVNTSFIKFDSTYHTSTVLVELDSSGERTFSFLVNPSADQFLNISDLPDFHNNEWLHCCSIALANNPSRNTIFEAIKRVKSAGGYLSFDPNIREDVWTDTDEIIPLVMQVLAQADFVKLSEDEALFLTNTGSVQDSIVMLNTLNIPLTVITLGSSGSLVIYDGKQYRVPCHRVVPVDTTGAGDAFVGGVLAYLSAYDDWLSIDLIIEAVQWGNYCGGLATTKKGAMSALPYKRDLLALFKETPPVHHHSE